MAPSFVSPDRWVWSSILMLALASSAPANVQGGDCPASSRCGSLTIMEPFGIVPEHAMASNCGQIGFQVSCQDDTPYLGYYRRSNDNESHNLQILDIFYGNGSLLVADLRKLADLTNLRHKDCQQYNFPSTSTSSRIALPFSISPINQELILYDCAKPPALATEGIMERRCGNSTFVARVGGGYDYDEMGNSSRYFLEGCTAIVVPVLAGYGNASASNYEDLISDGFLMTWPLTTGKSILGTSINSGV
ncbi:unnamed protein product [Urochloa humidicola]